MTEGFRIEALSTAHDRKPFTSGAEPLDRYLRELATQDVKRRVSNCFVALDSAGVIAGYYTFAAASLPLMELSAEGAKIRPEINESAAIKAAHPRAGGDPGGSAEFVDVHLDPRPRGDERRGKIEAPNCRRALERLPRYALLPAGLIGRLAIDQTFQGQRLGGALIMDAAARASRADSAIFALIVDAKDDAAIAFYEHLQFRRFASKPASLFLPVATALRALNATIEK